MAWFDEMDEQTQRQWRSRLEKGRLELSASIEQTLAEGVAEEEWVDEDGEEGSKQVVDEYAGESRRGTTVIPPRLSLQTKPMYAVAAASQQVAHQATQEAPLPAPALKTGVEQEQQLVQEKQQTGVFSRLAQRITTSLAAITLPFQAQAQVPQPTEQEVHVPLPGVLPPTNLSMQTVTTVRVERSETTTTIIESSPLPYPVPPAGLPPLPSVPQLPRPEQIVQGEGKSRPAGYPTKVHLEAAPKALAQHSTRDASAQNEKTTYPVHGSTEPLALRKSFSVPRSAPPTVELPTVNAPANDETREATGADQPMARPPVERRFIGASRIDQRGASPFDQHGVPPSGGEAVYDMTTSGRLPSVRMPDTGSNEVVSRSPSWMIFGSGNFDPGEGDVAIASPSITGGSVVMVMLASDPGPVVVQYVSLQPGIGFTVHLSAPTKVKTLFNYVVLRGES